MVDAPSNLPDRVAPDELGYLRRLQEELKQAHYAVLRAEGALASETRRLRERYGAGPMDSVDMTSGLITRN